MTNHVDLLIGAVFVAVYSFNRFNTPPTNRSSTTAARFYSAMTFYCAIGLGFYAVLVNYPNLLGMFLQDQDLPQFAKTQSAPLMTALILTVLLPKLPLLSQADEAIRRRLQYMAAIPREARELSAELRRATFEIAEPLQARVRVLLAAFAPEDVVFERSPTSHYLWTKITAVMAELEGWDDSPGPSFVGVFPSEFAELQKRYEQLTPKALRCFELIRDQLVTGDTPRARDAVEAYRRDFQGQAEELVRSIYDFISRGVLQCQLTHRARVAQLTGLGLRVQLPPAVITLDQHVMLFMGITTTFLFVLAAARHRPGPVNPIELFLRSAMIAAIYVVAVWCAIYPKTKWAFAQRRPDELRPVASYGVAGLMAVAVAIPITLVFKGLLHWPAFGLAWKDFTQTWPWVLLSFTTAFVTAWLSDDTGRSIPPRWLRWIEGSGAATVALLTAWGVHWSLRAVANGRDIPSIWLVLAIAAGIGFAIGAMIPSWYRESRKQQELQVLRRGVAVTPAVPIVTPG